MTERDRQQSDPEVPVEDAIEQRTEVDERDSEDEPDLAVDMTDEADPADVAEQGKVVDLDDDDYR